MGHFAKLASPKTDGWIRQCFEVFKNLYGMYVQVDETAKSKKEGKTAVWETFVKATPE